MNKPTRAFCWLVLQLDRFPRYGRLYSMDLDDIDEDTPIDQLPYTTRWCWQRRGFWGCNLLGRMNLLWGYIGPPEVDWDDIDQMNEEYYGDGPDLRVS